MDKKLRRNWLIIAAVLAISFYWLYPPKQKLVPGPDLAGGTTLLYEVSIPEGADTEETLKRVIDVVSKRIDPEGVRNLVFQVEAGNRIQILMPHPSREVVERRREYQRLLTGLTDANVSSGEVMAALKAAPAVRAKAIENLVRGVESRRELFAQAADRFDDLQRAEQARQAAGAEAGSEQDIELAAKVADARLALRQVVERIEATNIDPMEIGRVLELTRAPQRDPKTKKEIPDSSPRAEALKRLYQEHPGRQAQIEKLVAAYDAYYANKGLLDDPNDLIRLLQGQGVLEFRITVDPQQDFVADLDSLRQTLRERGPGGVPRDAPMRWYVIDQIDEKIRDVATARARGRSPEDRRRIFEDVRRELAEDPATFFLVHEGLIGDTDGRDYYILLWNTDDRSLAQRASQPGWQLTGAGRTVDELGRPAVSFQMNETGASYLRTLTRNNLKRRMAIVLDNRVYSEPVIQSDIGASGQITGQFSEQDLNYLINTLAAGSLQARLSPEPIEVRTIQPTLGTDNLQRGLGAGIWAIVAVGLFMTSYYFFGGLVANLALLTNLVIILGVMAKLKATFTLPGVAGVILNIGMCVDANVLIFERVREELRRGANMLTALRVGHDKAFSAILDGNMTTLIVCIVLAWFGTADVRGFGVTLGIGLVATLFTAVFMAHTILESYYRRFPSQKLQMLPLVVPRLESALQPRVQWMRHRRLFYTASVILSILGLSLCFARGADLFDIEFRSGTEVSFDLREGHAMSRAEVEEAMEDTALKGNATVVVAGETDEEHRGSEFSIITSETDSEKVSAAIRQAMAGHINVDPVIEFRGNDASQPPDGVIFPVHAADLGEVIGRSDVHRDISEFRGGVAIVLDQVRPSLTTDELRQRITATRLQPDFEGHQFRPFQVIGLEPDPSDPTRFMSLVVVSRDAAEGAGGTESGHEELASSEWNLVRTALTREQSFSKVSRFTPVVARTLTYNAIVSLGLGLLGILAYIWVRFGSLRYGLAAVVAVFHDVTIVLGIIAASAYIYQLFPGNPLLITPFKINMGMIAALLTVVGYSLNDTIVVFDRVRENRGKLAHVSEGVINDSVNQTLSRTLLTGVSTLMAILLLYILGREAIRGFAMAIFVGIVVGTYSSIGIASPLLLLGSQSGRPSRGGERSTPEKSPAAQR